MALLQGIRDYFAKRNLKKLRNAKRSRKVINYYEAKEIGIIYPSDNESKFVLVKQFIEYFKKEHGISQVKALGFINEKEAPFYHSHILNHDYYTAKDLSWYGNPTCSATESFIEQEFDILIDLSENDRIPIRFVLERSNARFKVGRDTDSESYDMVLEMKKESTLDQYIKQVNHFLRSINHHEERKRV
jgi:hypothetical protein